MNHDDFAQTGKRMFIIVWLLFFVLMGLFFYYHTRDEKGGVQVQAGKIIIKADKEKHYRIDGVINDYPVHFLLDTGATIVAIPEGIADKIGLISYYPITAQTANGFMQGHLTRLSRLTVANFVFYDVKAMIIPGGIKDTILLGMNVLSHFEIIQKDGDLTLSKSQ